jgi:hypothetical protein
MNVDTVGSKEEMFFDRPGRNILRIIDCNFWYRRLSGEAPGVIKLKDWTGAARSQQRQNTVALASFAPTGCRRVRVSLGDCGLKSATLIASFHRSDRERRSDLRDSRRYQKTGAPRQQLHNVEHPYSCLCQRALAISFTNHFSLLLDTQWQSGPSGIEYNQFDRLILSVTAMHRLDGFG